MAELSDEVLMAYVDGALDASDRATVEAALQQRPEYQQKLDMFRATREPIQLAFERDQDRGRLVSEMTGMLQGASGPATTLVDPSATNIVSLAGRRTRRWPSTPRPHLSALLAASIAMVIGGVIGWSLRSAETSAVRVQAFGRVLALSDDGLLAQGELRKLLETARSGVTVALPATDGESWQLAASFTFRSTKGSPCRRYEMSNKATGRFAGFACRSIDGQWLVHSHAKLDARVPDRKGFVPAATDDAAALDAAIRASMSGDVLETAQEAKLIASGWKSDQK